MGQLKFPEPLHEALVLWPAYSRLARDVSRGDPATADPQSMWGSIVAIGDRAAALLYAEAHAETLEACTEIVKDVLTRLHSGRRIRSGKDFGFGAEDIVGPKPTEGGD
jgi:hypothetical protein